MARMARTPTRRRFLQATAAAAGRARPLGATRSRAESALPSPALSGIEHIVVVMMKNRSFDHLLGWLPGANGQQAGLSYLDSEGHRYSTSQLSTYVGCA